MPLTSSQKYSGKLNKTFEHVEQKKCYLLFDGHFTRLIFLCQTSPVLNGSNKYEAKSNGMTKIMD